MSPIAWNPTTQHEEPNSTPPQNSWAIGDPWFGISMGLLGVIAGYAANVYIF